MKKEDVKNPLSDKSPEQSGEEEEKETLPFSDLGSYEYESDSLVITASLPLDEEGNFIKEVYDYGVNQIEQFQSSNKDIGNMPETASFPWSLDLDYKKYESQTIVSYVVQGYEYTGGAHGNAVVQSFNYSKENGKLLKIQDVISDDESLETFSLLAQKELTVDYAEGVSASPENWSVWYAHDEGVTFVFAPYQIAAYAVGQQEFTIVAIGEHKDLFKEKYFTEEAE
jgi:hypothetical protein